jgi:hypothetical protein
LGNAPVMRRLRHCSITRRALASHLGMPGRTSRLRRCRGTLRGASGTLLERAATGGPRGDGGGEEDGELTSIGVMSVVTAGGGW